MSEGPTLSLPIDASGARRGAQEFASAVQMIEAAGQRASNAIAGLNTSISSGASSLQRSQSLAQAYVAQLNAISASQRNAATSAKSYADSMARASSQVSALGTSASDSAGGFSIATAAVGSFVGGLGAMAASEAISFLVSLPGQLVSVADSYGRLDDRINLYTQSMRDIGTVHSDLLAVANRTGTSFEATGGFFAKVASQSKNLQLSYEEIIQLTETLQNGFKVSGASATETAAAMQQLGQSFAKGKLNGDELVSVSENAPRVMDALSDAFGVNAGVIRQWAEDGDLSAQAVAAAMAASSEKIRQEAESMGGTVQESAIKMQNAFNELMVKLNEATGASETAISALDGITSWMNSPAGTQAVNDFSSAINTLIGFLGDLASVDISRISMIADAVAYAKNAVQGFLSGSNALGKIAEQTLGYTTGGGMGGEFDTPGSPTALLGEGAFNLPGLQMAPEAAATQTAITPKTQEALRKRFGLDPNAGQGRGKKGRGGGAKKVDPSIAGLERAREQLAQQQEDIELFGRERDQAIARAVESLGKYATPDMKAKSAELAGTLFDLKQLQSQKEALESLSSTVRTFGNERAKAEESAVKNLGDFATPEQVQKAKDYANQLIDLQNKQEALERAESERQRLMQEGQSVTQSVMTAEQQYAATVENLNRLLSTVVVTQSDYDKGIAQLNDSLSAGAIGQDEYNAQVAKLGELLNSTAISQDTYNKAIAAAAPPTWGSELLKLGDSLNSFDNQFQTLESGIMGFSSIVTDAFTDAIFSGESFGVTMEKLGMSIAEMTTKLLIQLALQQAIGAGLQGMFGAPAGAPVAGATTAGGNYAMFSPLAKGGAVRAKLPHGVYTQPTYFAMQEPGVHAFARGTGLMGEAGPEAVLPLRRDASGNLGVTTTIIRERDKREDDPQKAITNYIYSNNYNTRETFAASEQQAKRDSSRDSRMVSERTSSLSSYILRDGDSRAETDKLRERESSAETERVRERDSSVTSNILRERDSRNERSSLIRERDAREQTSERLLRERDSQLSESHDVTSEKESREKERTNRFRDRVTAYRLGGNFVSSLHHTIYNSPTYFEMRAPGETKMARGLGLLGEAGPEAVLPLTKTPTGQLGVRAIGASPGQQSVLPLRRTSTGILGVQQAFAKGGVLSSSEENNYITSSKNAQYNQTSHNVNTVYNQPRSTSYNSLSRFSKGGIFSSNVDSSVSSNTDNRRSYAGDTVSTFARGGVFDNRQSFSKNYDSSTYNSLSHPSSVVNLGDTEYSDAESYSVDNSRHYNSPSFLSTKTFAYGDTIRASLPHGVYRKPTTFAVDTPGYFPFAKGSGVVGEAGPEAVLPLVRGPGGTLGVQSDGGGRGGGTTVNVVVNNNSKANVSTENKENADGSTDVMVTIADHVENVVATRMMRSGSKVNKAVPQVGRVVAR